MLDCDEPTGVLGWAKQVGLVCLVEWPGVVSYDEPADQAGEACVLSWRLGQVGKLH